MASSVEQRCSGARLSSYVDDRLSMFSRKISTVREPTPRHRHELDLPPNLRISLVALHTRRQASPDQQQEAARNRQPRSRLQDRQGAPPDRGRPQEQVAHLPRAVRRGRLGLYLVRHRPGRAGARARLSRPGRALRCLGRNAQAHPAIIGRHLDRGDRFSRSRKADHAAPRGRQCLYRDRPQGTLDPQFDRRPQLRHQVGRIRPLAGALSGSEQGGRVMSDQRSRLTKGIEQEFQPALGHQTADRR